MSSATQPRQAQTVDALVDVLKDALKALAVGGEADRANRLAGRAYMALRQEYPEQAQRINVLMHALCRMPNTTQGADDAHHRPRA